MYISELKVFLLFGESSLEENILSRTSEGKSVDPLLTEMKLSFRTLSFSNTYDSSLIACMRSFSSSIISRFAWSYLRRSKTSSVTLSKERTEGSITSEISATITSESSSRISAKSFDKFMP